MCIHLTSTFTNLPSPHSNFWSTFVNFFQTFCELSLILKKYLSSKLNFEDRISVVETPVMATAINSKNGYGKGWNRLLTYSNLSRYSSILSKYSWVLNNLSHSIINFQKLPVSKFYSKPPVINFVIIQKSKFWQYSHKK